MPFFGFGECKPCSQSESADPAKDTVKFPVIDKENMSPQINEEEAAAAAAKEARERERAEAEATYQRELVEERKRAEEQQRKLEEEARTQREAEEVREAEERARVEEARKVAEEAERRRQAQEAEEERIREEEVRREREAREAQEAAEKKQKVQDFLKKHGYADVNAKRKSKFGRYKFALHTAVKHNPDIVPLLVEAGAEPSNKNSAGLTPYEYAKKLKSSSEKVLGSSPLLKSVKSD